MAANHPLTLAFILERRPGGDPGGRRRRGDRGGQAAGVPGRLQPEYDWDAAATDDEGVTDSAGAAGPVYRVRPGSGSWDVDMRAPTRWSFTDSTTSLTP
jgi:hypothetical protein